MDRKSLSESDICAKFITPALQAAGWDEAVQIRREVTYTSGRRARGRGPTMSCTIAPTSLWP